MLVVTRSSTDLGQELLMSAEHWLSQELSRSLSGSKLLREYVDLVSEQSTPRETACFILDTCNAREGLLDIPIGPSRSPVRTSAKKRVRGGDVLVSRLRPYLRQVVYMPKAVERLLGCDAVYCSTEFYVLRPRNDIDGPGLASWVLSAPIQRIMAEATTGGHHPRINSDLLMNAPIEDKFFANDLAQSLLEIFDEHLRGQCRLREALAD